MVQSYEETKLYISPSYTIDPQSKQTSLSPSPQPLPSSALEVFDQDQLVVPKTSIEACSSVKLKRRLNAGLQGEVPSKSDTGEIGVKDLLAEIVDKLSTFNVSQWFNAEVVDEAVSLFEPIQQALNHIDFNLKRNSDFINELTKLLDTSRVIKQEAHLKKVSKQLEEERMSSLSTPSSPALKSKESIAEEAKKKPRSSFKAFSTLSLTSKSTKDEKKSNTLQLPEAKDLRASLSQIDDIARYKLNQNSQQPAELNIPSYIELETEVEKVSFHLESMTRQWFKLDMANSGGTPVDTLRSAIEFQSFISNLNSTFVVKELEQALFKLNWLMTSKSGFSEPNWQSSVLSLTPSTTDSFIGVNLLKNYYKHVKYDFVSYKLFTRQMQLIQLCAIILGVVHRIMNYYREAATLSTIVNNGGFSNEGI